jgi:hypothetical protein
MGSNRNVFDTLSGVVVRDKGRTTASSSTSARLVFGIGIGTGTGIDSNHVDSEGDV